MAARLLHDDVFGRLCRARDYLHAHHATPLTLDALARQASLSRYHFLRLFREAFGQTPHQYLIRVRLERAKTLLAAGNDPVTEVCFAVGFSSLGSFSTLFNQRVGCSPSGWRRRIWQMSPPPHGPAQLAIPWCFLHQYGTVAATA